MLSNFNRTSNFIQTIYRHSDLKREAWSLVIKSHVVKRVLSTQLIHSLRITLFRAAFVNFRYHATDCFQKLRFLGF